MIFFNILAYVGLIVFSWGIIDKPRQALLFFAGGLLLWIFANRTKNQIFVGAQSIMLIASFMRLMRFAEVPRVLPTVVVALTAVFLVNMLTRGDFSIRNPLHLTGIGGAVGLILGIVFAQSLPGNLLFAVGGILMIQYSFLVSSPPFIILNVIFLGAVMWEIVNPILSSARIFGPFLSPPA